MNLEGFPEHNPYEGEMTPFERQTLYKWIVNSKPTTVIEIGTGTGGGGTFYIAKALMFLNTINEKKRTLYTCDPERSPSISFLKEFEGVVKYAKIKSTDMFKLIKDDVDFIFFDGPEDPEVAYNDIKLLEEKIKPGTMFVMHDWEITKRGYDGGISTKALKIRPYIEKSENWTEVEILSGTVPDENGIFNSVGLCLYKFK